MESSLNHETPKTKHKTPISRISLLKGMGTGATWVLPAVIGGVNVARAPQHMKMRTLFEEGFGVVGDAAGTIIGAKLVGAGIVSALCLGSLGAFIIVAVCATAGGIALMEGGKWGDRAVYDAGERFGNQIYHSLDDLIEAF